MNWNRQSSSLEELMVKILNDASESLTLHEITNKIKLINPHILNGKTPANSLYSVIYRREKRRLEKGIPLLFNKNTRGGAIYYSVNQNGIKLIGKRIT